MAADTINSKPVSSDGAVKNTAAMDTHTTRSSRARRKTHSSSYTGWLANKGIKVAIWYTLVTVLFRCPTTDELTADSPRVCKPYLQAKDYLTPYAAPYYDQYLSSYVSQVQPYYNSIHQNVYTPGQALYARHGAPRVADAQKLSQQQWEKTIRPQLDVLQTQAGKQYQAVLAPHVKKATDVVQPYYDSVTTSAGDIWTLELEPVYRKTSPYVQKLYVQGQEFAVKTALPQAQFVGNTAWSFWMRQVWPKLRILYGENVEPQLMRITERLGRYKDGKKLEAGIASMENSSKLAEASASAESVASSLASTASKISASPSSASSSAVSASSTPEPKEDPTVTFHDDLKSWKQLCAKAVEEGSEDLSERIKDITAQKVGSAGNVGDALVTQLEQTSESSIDGVKARIQSVVKGLPEDASDKQLKAAEEEVVEAIRAVGQTLKARAQAVRDWRQKSDTETALLVEKALQSTLETVDGIRELRLTEIGRKYASSSLPHKEWSKYNELKKAKQVWRDEVEKAAHSHPGLAKAKAAVQDVEHTAMAVAEDAAKELFRLKAVGAWKIAADDRSDDFETKTIPAPVRKFKDQIVEKVAQASEAVIGSEQGTVESATSVAAAKASEYASSASEAVMGSSTGSVESVASQASSAASSVSKKVVGSSTGSVESVASQASSSVDRAASQASLSASSAASVVSESVVGSSTGSVESAASKVSAKVVGSQQPIVESVSSQASKSARNAASVASENAEHATKSAKSAASVVSESVIGTESGISDSATDAASAVSMAVVGTPSGIYDSATDAASSASSAILGEDEGRPLKEFVENQFDPSHIESIAAMRESKKALFADANAKVNAAASKASGSVSSIVEPPVASQVSSSVSSATSKASKSASSVVEPPVASQASSSISSAASKISKSASSIVEPPVASQASSSVSSVVSEASSAASKAYESPKKVYGGAMAQVVPEARGPILDDDIVDTGASYSERVQSMANDAGEYASQLTQAVQDALKGATSTQGSVESVTSLASEQYQSAIAAASVALYGTQANAVEKGTSAAHEQYLSAVTAASYAIYGTPATAAPFAAATSYYNSAVAEAGRHYEQAMSRVSAQVSGTPAPVHEQMFASVEAAYFAAVQAANGRLSSAFAPKTQDTYASISSVAASRLSEGLSAASAQYQSAKTAVGAEPTPVHQQYLASAQQAYYQALGVAHGRYSEFLTAASSAVAPTPTATGINSALGEARKAYSSYLDEASSKYSSMSEVAVGAASSQSTNADSTLQGLKDQLADAAAVAHSKLSEASASVTSAFSAQTTGQPIVESVSSRASENWEALISRASEQVYGAPAPFTQSAYTRASELTSQATEAAVAQWESVSALLSELIVGKEPDFTESVYSRLQSAYATGAPALVSSASSIANVGASSASSYASEAYESAASVVQAVFVPPTEIPGILEQVTEQLNAAVAAASEQAYGTTKGTYEVRSRHKHTLDIDINTDVRQQATSAAASAYSEAADSVSSAIYGTETGYVELAQSSFGAVGSSASAAISAALYGSPTPTVEAASSAAASVYSSISSQAAESAAAVSASISAAIYGEEQTYLEGVQSQISAAVASANSRLSEFGLQAGELGAQATSVIGSAAEQATSVAGSVAEQAASSASSAASSVSSIVSDATERVRDEL